MDLGVYSAEPVDYPAYAERVAREVGNAGEGKALGVLACGTGIGTGVAPSALTSLVAIRFGARSLRPLKSASVLICLLVVCSWVPGMTWKISGLTPLYSSLAFFSA